VSAARTSFSIIHPNKPHPQLPRLRVVAVVPVLGLFGLCFGNFKSSFILPGSYLIIESPALASMTLLIINSPALASMRSLIIDSPALASMTTSIESQALAFKESFTIEDSDADLLDADLLDAVSRRPRRGLSASDLRATRSNFEAARRAQDTDDVEMDLEEEPADEPAPPPVEIRKKSSSSKSLQAKGRSHPNREPAVQPAQRRSQRRQKRPSESAQEDGDAAGKKPVKKQRKQHKRVNNMSTTTASQNLIQHLVESDPDWHVRAMKALSDLRTAKAEGTAPAGIKGCACQVLADSVRGLCSTFGINGSEVVIFNTLLAEAGKEDNPQEFMKGTPSLAWIDSRSPTLIDSHSRIGRQTGTVQRHLPDAHAGDRRPWRRRHAGRGYYGPPRRQRGAPLQLFGDHVVNLRSHGRAAEFRGEVRGR
jgi:hypothetical protein